MKSIYADVPDETLVAQMKVGNQEAFRALITRHKAKLTNTVMKHVRNQADADELVQDTFLTVYRKIDAFRGDSSFATWLFQIALNRARNHYWFFFRRKRHLHDSMQAPVGEFTGTIGDFIPGAGLSVPREAEIAEFNEVVAAAMKQLPGIDCELLTLRALDVSYEEIAEIQCIEVGTVKSRIARSRMRLRKLLDRTAPGVATLSPERHP